MRPRQFLDLAARLAESGGPADCRTAISRAYYAIFNEAEAFLRRMGFLSPKKDYKGSEYQSNARAAIKETSRMIEILENCPIHGERWKKIKQAIQIME